MIIQKEWGYEEIIVNKEYCGKILSLRKQHRCSVHWHMKKDETFYIKSGIVLMETEGVKRIMETGERIHIPNGMKHRFSGLENSEIVEFSTHDEVIDSYRDTMSGKIPDDEFKEFNIKHG